MHIAMLLTKHYKACCCEYTFELGFLMIAMAKYLDEKHHALYRSPLDGAWCWNCRCIAIGYLVTRALPRQAVLDALKLPQHKD